MILEGLDHPAAYEPLNTVVRGMWVQKILSGVRRTGRIEHGHLRGVKRK